MVVFATRLLGLLVLSVLPPLIAISAWFQKKLLLSARRPANIKLPHHRPLLPNPLQGMRTTRPLVREEGKSWGVSKTLHEHIPGLRAQRRAVRRFIPIVMTIGSYRGGDHHLVWRRSVIQERLTLGTLVAFIFYAGQFLQPYQPSRAGPCANAGSAGGGRTRAQPARHRAGRSAMPPTVRERPPCAYTTAPTVPPHLAPDGYPADIETLEFRHVDFSYEPGEANPAGLQPHRAFRRDHRPGRCERGGARAPIVNLAAAFTNRPVGSILVNGIDYRERSLAWYHAQSGYRPPRSASLRRNGAPKTFATVALKRLMPRSRKPPAWSIPTPHPCLGKWIRYGIVGGGGGNRLYHGTEAAHFLCPRPTCAAPDFHYG